MPMHRKNKSQRARPSDEEEQWFRANRVRVKKRNQIAKASRAKNRKK